MVPPSSNLAVVLPSHDDDDDEFHRRLTDFSRARLSPDTPGGNWAQHLKREIQLRTTEAEFVEKERAAVRSAAIQAPTDPGAFVTWFEDLKETGPGQHDALFPFLAEQASLFEMKWFLNQEMGHGPMLDRIGDRLGLDGRGVVLESRALGNLMVALAANRHYAYQSVGALGVVELTAPGRAEKVNQGMKRLGMSGDVRRYFALHATLDVRHSESWNREELRPLVAADPEVAHAIAEGALMRLRAGAQCFERYRRELGFVDPIQRRIGIVQDAS